MHTLCNAQERHLGAIATTVAAGRSCRLGGGGAALGGRHRELLRGIRAARRHARTIQGAPGRRRRQASASGQRSYSGAHLLLPIFVALGVKAEGQCLFWNKVYDGALGWTAELSKFGAHAFQSDPHRIITFGGKPLQPAEVESPYIIRVAIALLMLASSIPGRSRIRKATPVRRAHPRFAENITRLGARVEWVEGD